MYFTIKFIIVYERTEATRDERVAAHIGEYSNFSNWIIRRNLVMLLTASNTELANSILTKIRLNARKSIFPVNLLVYFRLLSIWKRIANINLYVKNPVITVRAELSTKLTEYSAT